MVVWENLSDVTMAEFWQADKKDDFSTYCILLKLNFKNA